MNIRVYILFLFSVPCLGFAQSLFDNALAMEVVRKGAKKVYFLEMDSAQWYADQTEILVPGHPVVPAMEAFIILWQHIPVLQDDIFETFYAKLNEVITRAQRMEEGDPDAVFFEMAARGLLAEYYADQGQYMKAIGEAQKTYSFIKTGMEFVDDYPEYLFIVGLYNYFREAYPIKHPAYKPLLWFFMDGDMELGLEQIHRATRESALSRVEAYVYLIYIYLRYEETPTRALDLARELLEAYPTNPYVQAKYLETMAACKQYDQLSNPIMTEMISGSRLYYQIVGHVFMGIRFEMDNQPTEARKHYLMCVGVGDKLPNYAHFYKSLAWLGLGRIAADKDQDDQARGYLERAIELSQTSEVREEARDILATL